MTLQFKCPNCGGDMQFDAASGYLKCPHCDHSEKIEGAEMSAEIHVSPDFPHQDQVDETGALVRYQCQNCGAMLVTERNTTATTCSYCGAPVVLSDRLEGTTKPDYVIPFKIPKENADQAFRDWCKKLRYSPSDFKNMVKVKKVEGLYAPFWVYNVSGQGEARAHATISHSHTEGDYEVTETAHYDIYRSVDTFYRGIPADASERLTDNLMDLMEPFDYTQMVPFNAPYLTGYMAENYDYNDTQVFPRVQKRIYNYMDDFVRDSIHGYDTVTITDRDYIANRSQSSYCLFPIWMNYVTYKGKDYSFAQNGETGKIVGKPPISWGAVAGYIAGWTFGIFILLRIICVLMGGPLL